jgi:hypothetical protein
MKTPILELHEGILLWQKLGWIPYCPEKVRKHLPFIKSKFLPYNAMRWRATGKLRLFYPSEKSK